MVPTVMRTTVSTVATVVMAGSLGLVAVITLLVLLVQKEPIAVSDGPRATVLVRPLNIAIAPLLMAFAISMMLTVIQTLGQRGRRFSEVVGLHGAAKRAAFFLPCRARDHSPGFFPGKEERLLGTVTECPDEQAQQQDRAAEAEQ
jgi:hypothetical protein